MGQIVELTTLVKHSVVVAGHHTSISLEEAFWIRLKSISECSGKSINRIVTEIDQKRTGNLSSALRVYILTYKKEKKQSSN